MYYSPVTGYLAIPTQYYFLSATGTRKGQACRRKKSGIKPFIEPLFWTFTTATVLLSFLAVTYLLSIIDLFVASYNVRTRCKTLKRIQL